MSNTYQPESLHPYIMDARLKKATGSGGISNIPIASAETLGGIKVPADSGITITGSGNAYVPKPPAYSTTEVETGETYNGAKVYAKEITLAEPTAIAATDYPTLIADATGFGQFISGAALQQGGGCLPVNVFIESGAVKTHTFDAYTCTGYIIKYTKTE